MVLRAVPTSRLREGLVVDASDPQAKGDGEGRLLRGHGHLVQDDGLEVTCDAEARGVRRTSAQGRFEASARTLVLRRAREVGELLLRTDRTRRSGRRAACEFEWQRA